MAPRRRPRPSRRGGVRVRRMAASAKRQGPGDHGAAVRPPLADLPLAHSALSLATIEFAKGDIVRHVLDPSAEQSPTQFPNRIARFDAVHVVSPRADFRLPGAILGASRSSQVEPAQILPEFCRLGAMSGTVPTRCGVSVGAASVPPPPSRSRATRRDPQGQGGVPHPAGPADRTGAPAEPAAPVGFEPSGRGRNNRPIRRRRRASPAVDRARASPARRRRPSGPASPRPRASPRAAATAADPLRRNRSTAPWRDIR